MKFIIRPILRFLFLAIFVPMYLGSRLIEMGAYYLWNLSLKGYSYRFKQDLNGIWYSGNDEDGRYYEYRSAIDYILNRKTYE